MRECKPVAGAVSAKFEQMEGGSSQPWQERQIPQEVREDTHVLRSLLLPLCGVCDSQMVAEKLVAAFGSLGAVLSAPEHRLAEHADPGTAAHLGLVHSACKRLLRERIKDRPIISSWQELEDYLLLALRHESIEKLFIFFLDTKNGLIAEEEFHQGTVNHVPTYPREVAKRCVQLDASAIIMVHNHPSGNPKPSKADVDMTRQVVAALSPLGIAVHDHAIVGRNEIVSLRASRLL